MDWMHNYIREHGCSWAEAARAFDEGYAAREYNYDKYLKEKAAEKSKSEVEE